jgi:hypothetical protein
MSTDLCGILISNVISIVCFGSFQRVQAISDLKLTPLPSTQLDYPIRPVDFYLFLLGTIKEIFASVPPYTVLLTAEIHCQCYYKTRKQACSSVSGYILDSSCMLLLQKKCSSQLGSPYSNSHFYPKFLDKNSW